MPSLEATHMEKSGLYDDGSRKAALLGVHLVSQILDEACTVINAAQRIGWPYTCVLSIYKDVKSGKLAISEGHKALFDVSQGDNAALMDKSGEELTDKNVFSSTPLKDECSKQKPECSFIGQGDEEIDPQFNELSKSTSTLINNLFDMSEDDVSQNDAEIIQEDIEENDPNDALTLSQIMMTHFTEKLFLAAFDIAYQHAIVENIGDEHSTDTSNCPFLGETYDCEGNNLAFYVEDDKESNEYSILGVEVQSEVEAEMNTDEGLLVEEINRGEEEELQLNNVIRYENAYLSMNRDYDQASDDDGDPILQDPKGLPMHEVELFNASTSDDESSAYREEAARKELAATSGVSGVSGSRKSRTSLVSRCRSQGARLLSCLRGWWRRKTPGKRKENRHGSNRGVCPLSPDARRRAASLLDQRHLYSPVPSRSVAWKFNTVNETLVQGSRWKDYAYEKEDEYKEYC